MEITQAGRGQTFITPRESDCKLWCHCQTLSALDAGEHGNHQDFDPLTINGFSQTYGVNQRGRVRTSCSYLCF